LPTGLSSGLYEFPTPAIRKGNGLTRSNFRGLKSFKQKPGVNSNKCDKYNDTRYTYEFVTVVRNDFKTYKCFASLKMSQA